jgi:hypothetical protein
MNGSFVRFLNRCMISSCPLIGDDGHHALEQVPADRVEEVRAHEVGAVTDGGKPIAREAELSQLLQDETVIGHVGGKRSTNSGLAERTFCMSGVASESGGVKISSTTSFRQSFSGPPSRIGFMKLIGKAVLSEMMPTVVGRLPLAFSARSRSAGRLAWGARGGRGLEHVLEAPLGDEIGVRQGQPGNPGALGDLGDGEGERAQPRPIPPTTSGSCATSRWAASLAFSAESPASRTTSRSFAPPSALIPPCALMSATAMSAPSCISLP